jgi:hypothetical protein
MLAEIASSRFGFWIVALLMTSLDSAFLLQPGKFAFSLSRCNDVRLKASAVPFTLRDKELVSSLLSFPFELFFISDVAARYQSARQTRKTLSLMRRLKRQARIFSLLSGAAALVLIFGPCLAAFRGIQFSVLLLLPSLYLLAIAASAVLWRKRRIFGLSDGTALRISVEITLCPVLLVNLSKRISLAQSLELNTFALASFSKTPEQTRSLVRENMQYHHGA